MKIKEYLSSKKTNTLGEFEILVKELPNENPSKEELLAFAIQIASNMSRIYNKGFDDCLTELDKIDANFLSRKKPPHLK